mmetsp:Transcript_12823/g.42320  ORF Transcript_12823/g.42320 Transcript_12823/m.42320 type:complete len:506 (+) Transcript_12823:20-1537(+)
MTTLAESFLADLDDLSDDGDDYDEDAARAEGGEAMAIGDGEDEVDDLEALANDSLEAVARLRDSPKLQGVLKNVEVELAKGEVTQVRTGPIEEDATYQLIVDCNSLSVDIENELVVIHNYIRDKYRPKFPELESLVLHPVDYARVVKAIGNEMDMTLVDLEGILPSATIMVVSVTGSTTNGQALGQEELDKAVGACDVVLELDAARGRLMTFVESRMASTAPNLSAVLGTQVAAQLMGTAGGLISLSKMPACNVQVLGSKRKTLAGMSSASAKLAGELHAGFVFQCDLIQKETPPALRPKVARLVGSKCTLMARVDAYGEDPTGSTGQKMLEEMRKKVEKMQDPGPAKTVKPLPKPDMEQKKRRGGRRLRKMKERYGLSDMRKAANRLGFNQPEEDFGLEGEGMGMLGGSSGGSGAIRMAAAAEHAKTLARAAKKYEKKRYGSNSNVVSGLSSSMTAFTPIQGIELAATPMNGASTDGTSGTDSVFSDLRGFKSVAQGLPPQQRK